MKMSDELRARCNQLTKKQRAHYLKRGLSLINAGPVKEMLDFRTASVDAQRHEIFHRAINNLPLTHADTLAMYANQGNWRQDYDQHGCKWVWVGPVTCGPEAAQSALRPR